MLISDVLCSNQMRLAILRDLVCAVYVQLQMAIISWKTQLYTFLTCLKTLIVLQKLSTNVNDACEL